MRHFPKSDERVGERTADHHEDTDPPEQRFDVDIVDDGYERLDDGLRVGADVVCDGRCDVDLHGADPADQEAESARSDEQRNELMISEQAEEDDALGLARAEHDRC